MGIGATINNRRSTTIFCALYCPRFLRLYRYAVTGTGIRNSICHLSERRVTLLCASTSHFRSSCVFVAFLFSRPRDAPFSESGTRSREIRSRIGRQSVGRTLRGLLLSRRSLPFKPPPILTLPTFLHPASSCPSPYLVPPSRGTFLSLSSSFLCTLGKPALTLPPPSYPPSLPRRRVSSRRRLLLRSSRRSPMAKPRRPD